MRNLHNHRFEHLRLQCCLLFVLLLMILGECRAQRQSPHRNTHQHAVHRLRKKFDRERYTTLGVSLAAMQYYGDLSPRDNQLSTDFLSTRPGIEISVGHKYSPYLKAQLRLLGGMISATDARSRDAYRHARNASFRNFITELSIVNLIEPGHHGFFIHRERVNLYGFVGIGVFHHNPKAKAPEKDLLGNPLPEAGKWVALQPLGTEGQYSLLEPSDKNYGLKPYRLFQPCIPFGVGVRRTIGPVFDFSFEIGFRLLFTDYLDDVSANYVDLGALNSALAKAMSYRTNELPGDNIEKVSYTGRDGETYFVKAGFGSEHPENKRGGAGDNDFYTTISFRLCYIIGEHLHKPKGR